MPQDDTDLHRLVWSPDDFDGEKLLPSAFRKQDFSGSNDDYVSVSRIDMLDPDAEIAIADNQAKKAGGNDFIRDEAWSVILNCGEIRRAEDSDKLQPFQVTSEPIPGENEAHCGIRNVSGKKGKGYVNELRSILATLIRSRKTLDDFLKNF